MAKKICKKKLQDSISFCMAPWTHTFVSPQSERRLCCASREESHFVQQYIDKPSSSLGEYAPQLLGEHWNNEFMKSVRKKMINGETVSECQICNDQVLSLDNYRNYFTSNLFPNLLDEVINSTDEDGSTTMKPRSFDYRISNQCNFKCRMCGELYSSAIESEKRKYNELNAETDLWALPEYADKISNFQNIILVSEFKEAINNKLIEEVYWAGGEPLMWDFHWESMETLVKNGHAKNVVIRTNTNLSKIVNKGVHLFDDLLPHFKSYNVCASIDAPGEIGEYIRSGLKWEKWLGNFKSGLAHKNGNEDSIVMDLTLTLPGLFGLKELFDIAIELESKVYTKLTFAFDPYVLMSPMSLPRKILDSILNDLIAYIEPRSTFRTVTILNALKEMKQRKTFEEEFPENYLDGFTEGRSRLLNLENRRNCSITMAEILRTNKEAYSWWVKDL
jgi:organic radical activating enzyme